MDEEREGLVLMLLEQGSTRHAIQLYREETGADREHAQRAIAELARRHGIRPSRRNWLPMVLVWLAGLAGAALVFAK